MDDYTTFRIRKKKKNILVRLAKKFEVSQIDFVENMIDFFDVTGVDPADKKVLSPAEELKKFRNTIISFMRNQEKEFIKPVFGKVDSMLEEFFIVANELREGNKTNSKNEIPKLKTTSEISEIKSPVENISSVGKKENEKLLAELERKKLEVDQLKKYLKTLLNDAEKKKIGLSNYTILNTSEFARKEMMNFINRLETDVS